MSIFSRSKSKGHYPHSNHGSDSHPILQASDVHEMLTVQYEKYLQKGKMI